MADFKFNIGRGKFREYHDRVANNDPANSALIIVLVRAVYGVDEATTDARLQDLDNLSLVLADADITEFDGTGYSRRVLTDADLTATSPDDANNRVDMDFADQTWTSVSADGSVPSITDALLCYDSDTTSGDDTNIIVVGNYDFVVTPQGGNVNLNLNAQGYATV